MVRAGFRMLLSGEQDMEVVAEASNGLEAVAKAARFDPTVILMDIRMPELDGLQATRRILATDNTARILILTTFGLDEYVYEALSAGASGFVLKDDPPEQLIEAVRTVAAGDALLSPAITKRVINQFTRIPRHEPPERTRRAHRTRARHPPAHRPRPVQRRDRRGALHQRNDRQDPRHAHPPETRPPRPRPSRRARVPDWARTGSHADVTLIYRPERCWPAPASVAQHASRGPGRRAHYARIEHPRLRRPSIETTRRVRVTAGRHG